MRIFDFIRKIFEKKKSIDIKMLPSQGFFYPEGFEMQIRKASQEEIEEYERDYDAEDLGKILKKLKKIVQDSVILPKGYSFGHIKSIDVVFIFLEIVAMTKRRPVRLEYYNDEIGMIDSISFGQKSFNYFRIDGEMLEKWDSVKRCFVINGYRFTLPSIGVENSLTNFLISKSSDPDAEKYNDYSYSFTYFVGNKEFLTFDEIENLVQIFNSDMESEEVEKVEEIVAQFVPMQRYSLVKGKKVIEISAKLNLQKIWK